MLTKCQFTLTVAEGKRMIAKAIAAMPEVRKALKEGMILLKGGTTVSAVSEELCGEALRISGRITPRGTVTCGMTIFSPHSIVLRCGVPEPADGHLAEIAGKMGPSDVCVCGANLIDAQGHAAMMAGRELCGEPGTVIPTLPAEGVFCIVAAGLEKLSPVPIDEACRQAGRKASVWSMGMAVGLVAVPGQVITELEALSILGFQRRWLIGRGGIAGAEGASTFVIEGEEAAIREFTELLRLIKGAGYSGVENSLSECLNCGPYRELHLACIHAGNNMI